MTKAIYNCSQDELYEACELIAASLKEELAAFTDLKPKYTLAYATDLEVAIKDAKMLPDDDQRTSEQEAMRITLRGRLTTCLKRMNALRLYIRDAYDDPELQKVRMEEAGFKDYDAASNANWDKLVVMMLKGLTFINTHEATLLANDNMPPSFKTTFSDAMDGLDEQVTDYLSLRENMKQATQAKIAANNAIYLKVTDICEDGAYLFANDDAKKAQFVWAKVIEIITPPGAAGLRGTVKNGVTFEMVSGASVQIQRPGDPIKATSTNAEGKFDFGNVPTGNYTGKVEASGYVLLEFEAAMQTGVTSFKHFTIMPEGNE